MATWPCPTIVDCACGENPFRNLSSENPDPLTFFARSFPPFPPTINGPLDTFWAPGCVSDCFSVVSQFDAEACALRQATICNNSPPTGNPAGPELFGNEPQSCEVACPMGESFSYSIPAGTFLAVNQELANLIAQSFCYEQAFRLRNCDEPPGPPNAVCPTITGVSPAGPINANVGDNITLTATYSFPGSVSALIFVWFLNGSPIAILHDDPTLQINDIMESEEGDYTLGIFANGCPPVFSNPITINVGCVAEVPPPIPPKDTGDGTFDYAARTSLGSFEVQETGNARGPGPGDGRNFTSLGALPAGWYDVVYQGGATEFTAPDSSPPFDPLTFYAADGFGAEFELGGVPIEVASYPFTLTNYSTCDLAEDNIAPSGTSLTGIFETTDSGGGMARVWGPAYETTVMPGFSMTKCNGMWPTLEVFNYVFEAMPLNLQIVHFDDFVNLLQVCSTCQDRVGIEWDGTLERVAYDPFFLSYQIGAPFSSATISLKGKRISTSSVEIILSEDPPGTPVWKLTIKCKRTGQPNGGGTGDIIWSGIKAAGRTPAGVYVSKEEACNPGKNPECCRIEVV